MTSIHYVEERKNRQRIIDEIGMGYEVDSFVVDRGHVNGEEIHVITSTGLIVIYNKASHKMVTILIARPQQIRRYYNNSGEFAPMYLIELAREHQRLGYNNY